MGNNILEEYNDIKTPSELLEFMDKHIKYGIHGTDNIDYTNWENDVNSEFQIACQTKYSLCDKDRILKYGLGICWDDVELERFWFKEHNYKFKTFFIWIKLDYKNSYSTHTYLVYEDNNKYYYFEYSDGNNKGIKEFDSYDDAIKYQMSKYIEYLKYSKLEINNEVLNHLEVIEYDNPKYGCDMNEYIDHILNSKIIYKNSKFID